MSLLYPAEAKINRNLPITIHGWYRSAYVERSTVRPPKELLTNEVGNQDEPDAAGFEFGHAFGESGNRCRVGMANGDGGAVASGVAGGERELGEDRVLRGRVVEENFARGRGHAGAFGGVVGDGRGGGAAVDEEKIAARAARASGPASAARSAVAREPS